MGESMIKKIKGLGKKHVGGLAETVIGLGGERAKEISDKVYDRASDLYKEVTGLDEAENEQETMRASIEQLTKKLEDKEKQVSGLALIAGKYTQLESDYATLKAIVDKNRKEYDALVESSAKQIDEFEKHAINSFNAHREEVGEYKAEIVQLEKDYRELERAKEEMRASLVAMEGEIGGYKSMVASFQASLQKKDEEIKDYNSKVVSHEAETKSLKNKVKKLNGKLEEMALLNREIDSVNEQLAQLGTPPEPE